jgi:hypothetical protein
MRRVSQFYSEIKTRLVIPAIKPDGFQWSMIESNVRYPSRAFVNRLDTKGISVRTYDGDTVFPIAETIRGAPSRRTNLQTCAGIGTMEENRMQEK